MWNGPIMQSIVMLDAFDKRYREYKSLGWVYVARNQCFADPVFKVGPAGIGTESAQERERLMSRKSEEQDQASSRCRRPRSRRIGGRRGWLPTAG